MNRLKSTKPTFALGLIAALMSCGSSAKVLDITLPAPGAFTTTIDNPYLSFPVGVSFAYRAELDGDCEYNKVTATADTKTVTVNGLNYLTRIVRDQAWEDEGCDFVDVELVEDTQDYYGQEITSQNVWYFGEQTWALSDESDECTDEGSWQAGMPVGDPEVDPAEPGIIMLGDPEPGDRYRQEFLADEAEDWANVMRLNARVSIGMGDFENCLETREWTPLEPGEIEHKYYCPDATNPGPGLVYIEELKSKNLYVEYIGSNFGTTLPGEDAPFPATALDCDLP